MGNSVILRTVVPPRASHAPAISVLEGGLISWNKLPAQAANSAVALPHFISAPLVLLNARVGICADFSAVRHNLERLARFANLMWFGEG
ncbi:MAG: hypothetical protein C5B44_05610 [Acidobacteria bacterium]|nr:MAG: hypothetical protein C5B44_05610 [Acidobacteriota bacterium]